MQGWFKVLDSKMRGEFCTILQRFYEIKLLTFTAIQSRLYRTICKSILCGVLLITLTIPIWECLGEKKRMGICELLNCKFFSLE